MDISNKVLFDHISYLTGTITQLSPTWIYLASVTTWLTEHTSEGKVYQVFHSRVISSEKIETLALSLPYKVLSLQARYTELQDNLRQKITFPGCLSWNASLLELAGKRLTLSYLPASSQDTDTIKAYGSLYNTPPYLIELCATLKLEGEIKATGNPITPGEKENLTISYSYPYEERIEKELTSGGYYGVGINLAKIPGELISKISERYRNTYEVDSSLYKEGLFRDELIGEALYFSSLNWLYQTDTSDNLIKSLIRVVTSRQAQMSTKVAIEVDYIWGIPNKLNLTGIRVDADRDTMVISPVDGDNSKIKKFMLLSLLDGSTYEHLTFDIPLGITIAVSAVKGLQIASQLGIPIYTITSENINTLLPQLQLSSDIKANIQNAINAGMEAIVPKQEITYCGWQGAGYIVYHPDTGAGSCLISGGAAGAETLVTMGIFADLFEKFSKNEALVVEGETAMYPEIGIIRETERIFTSVFGFWPEELVTTGALYLLGYCPIFRKIFDYHRFLVEITKPDYKIFFFAGHGSGGDLVLGYLLTKLGKK